MRTDGLVAGGAAALVASTVRHRLKTVVVRDDLIGWVQSGTKTLHERDGRRQWRRDEIFLLERGTAWDVENDPAPDGHYRAVVLLPGLERLRQFEPGPGPVRAVHASARLPADAELREALDRAARALDPAAPASAALQHHRLLEVLMLLAERGWRFEAGADVPWSDRVRRRIASHPAFDWSVQALAEAFAISASTLQRRLAAEHTTASDVVRDVRLETALALLHGTSLHVGEIAARCGYESHSRFSAAFRARFGLPPSDLRPVTSPAQRLTVPG